MRSTMLKPLLLKPLLVLPLAVFALTGCLRDPDPIALDDRVVTVHAVLEAGSDSVVVTITRTDAAGDRFNRYVGVSDAEVRVLADGNDVWLVEAPDDDCVDLSFGGARPEDAGAGCYRATLPSPIQAGTVHRLEIRLPDGTAITGETRTPEPVAISTPAPARRVTVSCLDPDRCYGAQQSTPPYIAPVATIPASWDAPPSVDRASLMLQPVAVYFNGRIYPGEACNLGYLGGGGGGGTPRDTLDWRIPNIVCGGQDFPELGRARFDSIRAELSVIGWNEHYSRYVDGLTNRGVRIEAASHGIDGAFGVFGAVSRSTRTVTLVRDPPPASAP